MFNSVVAIFLKRKTAIDDLLDIFLRGSRQSLFS